MQLLLSLPLLLVVVVVLLGSKTSVAILEIWGPRAPALSSKAARRGTQKYNGNVFVLPYREGIERQA